MYSHRILLKVVKSKEDETGDGITPRIKQDYSRKTLILSLRPSHIWEDNIMRSFKTASEMQMV